MDDLKERELYWDAVADLNEIIEAGNMTKERILSELDNDLEESD